MRILRPVLRLGGWVLMVIAALVGVVALIAAGNPETTASAASWAVAFAAFLISGGIYWILRRTAGETDDPAARYQPSSVLEEMAAPLLKGINEGSRPFMRGGVGIVTFVAWSVAVAVLATVWIGALLLTGPIMVVSARALDSVGIVLPDPVGWLALLVVLVVPIAVVVLLYRWASRRPAIRYWLRW